MKYINFYNREMLTIIDTSCNYFGSNDINYINSRKNSDLITIFIMNQTTLLILVYFL